MKNLGAGIATVGVWSAMAVICYCTGNVEHVGWGVGATMFIWFFCSN